MSDTTENTIQTTEQHPDTKADMWVALRVWWAWLWRAMLAGMAIGFAIGLVGGITVRLFSLDEKTLKSLPTIGVLIGLPVGVWFLKFALNKKYGDFRIAIIRDTKL